MISIENNTITFFLNSPDVTIPLQCVFLESGFYTVSKQKRYYHPAPPFNRIFLFGHGGGTIEAEGAAIRLESKKIYLLPKDMSFAATYDQGSDFFYFHFKLEDRFNHDVLQQIRELQTLDLKSTLFEEIIKGYLSPGFAAELRWQTYLFSAVMEFCAPILATISQTSYKSLKYSEILQYIRDNCNAQIRVTELARMAGMNRATLSKAFSKDFGISVKDYLLEAVLQKARSLLIGTDLPVGEIAYQLGYEDPYYFSRVFHEKMGDTPSEYRRSTRSAMLR